MIKLAGISQIGLELIQAAEAPVVYLDHWALSELAADKSLSARFATALEARGGTLALSWANLSEFSKVTSEEQPTSTETFIDSNLPRLFFLESDPFKVWEREDSLLAGGPRVAPHGDADLFREFAKLKPQDLKPFTSLGLFSQMRGQLRDTFERLKGIFVERVEVLRAEYATDLEFQAAVDRPPTGASIQSGLRFMVREVLRPWIVDKQRRVEPNDALDFYHVVVPAAYCEFVLVDKDWRTIVEQARSRLRRAGFSFPMADAISKSTGGVGRLVRELERGT